MRVLCINGDFSNAGERGQYLISVPKELKNYTVRDAVERGGRTGYLLEEIFGGIMPNGLEVSFDSSRFVPVEELDVFEEMYTEECLILVN